ncbi:hypothetical protein LTR02_000369 [Friedmanniomyces endolithicus]|nr:hypothetical protein LTR02_000369 [Friedmanniomyces endolithicus]
MDGNIEPSFHQHQQHQQALPASHAGVELAPQACSSCRRLCDYAEDVRGQAPSPEEFTALRQEVAELKTLLAAGRALPSNGHGGNGHSGHQSSSNGSYGNDDSPSNTLSSYGGQQQQPTWPGASTFPTLYFLDSNAFEYERFQIQAPYVRVPPGALSSLGSSQELRQMIEHYFLTIHSHFPIISKIRLYQHLTNPLHEPGADLALLFLAITTLASTQPPQTQLYQDVKSLFAYLESQNALSLQTIQALLLIALYEIGHAIYPAAYLTTGHAARLGHALGLHARDVPQMLPRPTTWTEQEERRRVWWAVILLDRFVNNGHRGKPFASADPSLDTHLPTDDVAWDKGLMSVAAPLALSASQTICAAPFARTCQAAHLLGKVVRHINDTGLPPEFRFEEALQLNRTYRALAAALPDEAETDDPAAHPPALCTSMAICYSALLTLYDTYSCTERANPKGPEAQLVMQKEAIAGLSDISAAALHLARQIRGFVETEGQGASGLGRLSPLVIDCFYQAAANYAWYLRESSDPQCGERLRELKEVLRLCEGRWRVAGEYLRIVETTEFALASAISALMSGSIRVFVVIGVDPGKRRNVQSATLKPQAHSLPFTPPASDKRLSLFNTMADVKTKASVLLVGGGSVGAIAALNLETGKQAAVTIVCRSNFNAVSQNGYNIKSCDHGKVVNWKPTKVLNAVLKASEDSAFDYIVCVTKNVPDVPPSLSDLIRPAVVPGQTVIVLIQNGLNIEKPLIAAYPQNIILSGVSLIGANEPSPGHIDQDFPDTLFIGAFANPNLSPQTQKAAAEDFVSRYSAGGKTHCSLDTRVAWTRWRKLVYNSCLNSICAITDLDTGRIRLADDAVAHLVRPAMLEIVAAAKTAGHELPATVVDDMIEMDPLDMYLPPSMLSDTRKGNFIEFENILGEPLREGERMGVPMPTLRVLYYLCQAVQWRNKELRGLVSIPPKGNYVT